MTLFAPDPWASVIAGRADQWATDVRASHPLLGPVSVAVADRTVQVVASRPTCQRTDAVWALAQEVARWWPGWLDRVDVDCQLSAGSLVVSASGSTMGALGGGLLGRREWFAAVGQVIG